MRVFLASAHTLYTGRRAFDIKFWSHYFNFVIDLNSIMSGNNKSGVKNNNATKEEKIDASTGNLSSVSNQCPEPLVVAEDFSQRISMPYFGFLRPQSGYFTTLAVVLSLFKLVTSQAVMGVIVKRNLQKIIINDTFCERSKNQTAALRRLFLV